MAPAKDLYLIDASIYIFRAWFSLPDTLTDIDGKPVNAVYGFMRFMTEFLERTQAAYLAVAFDESLTTSFRNELFPEYKANRESPPPELKAQFEVCKEFVRAAGIAHYSHERFEADDLIATIAYRMRSQGFRNCVVTRDKDLVQVLSKGDTWWDFYKDRTLGVNEAKERFGVRPDQMRDFLALTGDAVDNIPGVPAVGPKTAARLLWLYDDLEGVYKNLAEVPQLAMRGARKVASNLKEHKDQAFLSRRLATVVVDAPIDVGSDVLRRGRPDQTALKNLVERMDRGAGFVDRLQAVSPPG